MAETAVLTSSAVDFLIMEIAYLGFIAQVELAVFKIWIEAIVLNI